MARCAQIWFDTCSDATVLKFTDTDTNEATRKNPCEEEFAVSKAADKLKGLLLEQHA